jgi:phenylacetate-CoA ligase
MQITNQIERAAKNEIESFQVKLLNELLHYVNNNSSYYAQLFKENKIDIDAIQSLSDLEKIPFSTKDLLANNNDEFLCVDKKEVADFVTTSGTLGDPVTFYLTEKDIDRLAYNEAVSMECAGASSNDIFQLMTTMDKRFMAGLAYYQGVRMMGAGMIRLGPGSPFMQWDSIMRFNPTVLICIPSFIPKLIKFAEENNISYKDSSVKKIVCIGEPLRDEDFNLNELSKRILDKWDVELYSTYASTEMGSAFTECTHQKGGHLHPDLLILEVLDEHDKQVASGEKGEVVVTTLGVEGMPLIRYRTGDICRVYFESCDCGRNTPRLGPVIGRRKQMLKFKGTTLFPPVIFNILDQEERIDEYLVEVTSNEFGNDEVKVIVDDALESKEFSDKLKSAFKSKLRVSPEISFLPKSEILKIKFDPNQRKPKVFIDNRK